MYTINPGGLCGNQSGVPIGGGLDIDMFLGARYKVGSVFITEVLNGYPKIGTWVLLPDDTTIVGADNTDVDFAVDKTGGSNVKELGYHQHVIPSHTHTIGAQVQTGTSQTANGTCWYSLYTTNTYAGSYNSVVGITVSTDGNASPDTNMQSSLYEFIYRRVS